MEKFSFKHVFAALVVVIAFAGFMGFTSEAHAAPVKMQLSAPDGTININTAEAQELEILKGVGPAIAQKIVEYRTEHGPFESVEDLTLVRGIGERKLEKIEAYITV